MKRTSNKHPHFDRRIIRISGDPVTASLYDKIDALGWTFEPSPRTNPSGSLYDPWRLIDHRSRVVVRGMSRDDLEDAARPYIDQRYEFVPW